MCININFFHFSHFFQTCFNRICKKWRSMMKSVILYYSLDFFYFTWHAVGFAHFSVVPVFVASTPKPLNPWCSTLQYTQVAFHHSTTLSQCATGSTLCVPCWLDNWIFHNIKRSTFSHTSPPSAAAQCSFRATRRLSWCNYSLQAQIAID